MMQFDAPATDEPEAPAVGAAVVIAPAPAVGAEPETPAADEPEAEPAGVACIPSLVVFSAGGTAAAALIK
jgi:hypothetical protein